MAQRVRYSAIKSTETLCKNGATGDVYFRNLTAEDGGAVKLTANWKYVGNDTTYTVTYKPGSNGTGSQQTATKTYGVSLTLKGAIFTRTGYTQTGWTTEDGSQTYSLGGSYTTNASLTLYPVWTSTALADGGPYSRVVDGIEWKFTVSGGYAFVGRNKTSSSGCAIATDTAGSVTIPSELGGCKVTGISKYAFYNCKGITSVTIPNGIANVGEYSFYGCTGLVSVAISSTVTNIEKYAFSGCKALTSLPLSYGVVSIGDYAFENCVGLTSASIPGSVVDIRKGVFYRCKGLANVVLSCGIASIGDYAFYMCSGMTSVSISDSVTNIGYRAFYGCSKLTDLTLSQGVKRIGNSAFYKCNSITMVSFPEGMRDIGDSAFSYCSALQSVSLPASVESVGDGAFAGCTKLAEIKVASANQNFVSVDGVLYDKGVRNILACPCTKASVEIPVTVTNICNYAFSGCRQLTDVTIPCKVTGIGDYAFYACTGLTSVTIPNSVTRIGEWAFYSCSKLTNMTIPEGVTSIGGYAFNGCSGLTNITIPSSVTNIGNYVFGYCRSLTSVTIPSSVTSIGKQAFNYCSGLTSVTIPSSVTNIGSRAFASCSSLSTVRVDAGDEDRIRQLLTSSGLDCSGITFLTAGLMPELGEDPSEQDIQNALAESADTSVSEHITNAVEYASYRDWAGKVKSPGSDAAAGYQSVLDSPNAWVSFALGSDKLLEKPPTDEDLTVEKFEPSSESGKFDFTVSVEGVTVGDDALKENLKQVFGLEGSSTLNSKDFTSDNVDIDFGTPQGGKVKFTAGPKDADAGSFFMRVKVK